jgi:hypothetical protein
LFLCAAKKYGCTQRSETGRVKTVAQSRAAVVPYQDLLRLHLDERASRLIGAIGKRKRNGRTYLYETFRIGTVMVSRYLGDAKPGRRAPGPR